MGNAIEPVPGVSEFGAALPRPATADVAPRVTAPAATPSASQLAANYRLIIEPDADGRGYIYKTLDRRTGEIVHQFPREDIVRMREAGEYRAGTVIDSRA